MRQRAVGVALALEHDDADLGRVGAQMQDGVVEFARQPQRIKISAHRVQRGDIGGRRAGRPLQGDRRATRGLIYIDTHERIGQ